MRHHPLRKQPHRPHDLIVRQRAVVHLERDLRQTEPFHQHCDFLDAFLGPADYRTGGFHLFQCDDREESGAVISQNDRVISQWVDIALYNNAEDLRSPVAST
jgi:hypothetical protein